jgi:hypothetical protein
LRRVLQEFTIKVFNLCEKSALRDLEVVWPLILDRIYDNEVIASVLG